jgi:demethoxyubiquinone hydroxylase (CLK1/Coq7/Cat5 family)
MDTASLAKKLASLAQLDYDAMAGYEQAIKRIPDSDRTIRDELQAFHDDHRRNQNCPNLLYSSSSLSFDILLIALATAASNSSAGAGFKI